MPKNVDAGITPFQLRKLYLSNLQSRISKVNKKGEMVKEYLVLLKHKLIKTKQIRPNF